MSFATYDTCGRNNNLSVKIVTGWIEIMLTNALPTLNLLNQFLKQISKPVSFRIVKYAKTHPVFRRYFLIIPGRWFHSLDQRVRSRLIVDKKVEKNGAREEQEKKKRVTVDEETAIDAGANLMSECIIFLIAGFGVTAEVNRNVRNAAAKETSKRKEMEKLIDEKTAIMETVERQVTAINKLEEILNEYIRLASSMPSSSIEDVGEKLS